MYDHRRPYSYHIVEKESLVMGYVDASVRTVLLIDLATKRLTPFGIMDPAVTVEPHPPVYPYIPGGALKALTGHAGIDSKDTPGCTPSGASGHARCYQYRRTVYVIGKHLVIDANVNISHAC